MHAPGCEHGAVGATVLPLIATLKSTGGAGVVGLDVFVVVVGEVCGLVLPAVPQGCVCTAAAWSWNGGAGHCWLLSRVITGRSGRCSTCVVHHCVVLHALWLRIVQTDVAQLTSCLETRHYGRCYRCSAFTTCCHVLSWTDQLNLKLRWTAFLVSALADAADMTVTESRTRQDTFRPGLVLQLFKCTMPRRCVIAYY